MAKTKPIKEKKTRQPANVAINASFLDVVKIALRKPKKKGK